MKMYEKDNLVWEIETAQGKSKSEYEYNLWQKVLNKIAEIPVAEAEPIKVGHWIPVGADVDECHCTRCGEWGFETFKYCPWCGAKSEGVV